MRSRWVNQWTSLPGSSKFHEEVREHLCTEPFLSSLSCYQEVPVSDIVEGYFNSRHRYDWYLLELTTVVEVHGRQHYEVVNRGGISWEQARLDFIRSKERDLKKKQAALEAGLRYVEIHHHLRGRLTSKQLKKLILEET